MKKTIVLLLLSTSFNSYSQNTDSLVDFNTLTSLYVEAHNGPKPLWSGTGFFLRVKTTVYFITNNHIVGGEYHTEEFKNIHKNDSVKDTLPDVLRVRLFTKALDTVQFTTLKLQDPKGNPLYVKIYEQSNDPKTLLDVVAFPITGINEITGHSDRIAGYDSTTVGGVYLYPSQQLYVIGYPANTNIFYPIWKSGSIASEPDFTSIGFSVFWIDATTRGGMSGSPVVFRDNKAIQKDGRIDFFNALKTTLVGIYSAQNYNSELGVVTRIETIYKALYKIAN